MTYCFLDKTISLENIKIDSMFKLENGSKRSFLYIINSKEKLSIIERHCFAIFNARHIYDEICKLTFNSVATW